MQSKKETSSGTIRRVFRDAVLDAEFQRSGYVVLNLVEADAVAALRRKAKSLRSGVRGHFHASFWSKDRPYRETVDAIVKSVLEEPVLALLHDYKAMFSDLLIKRQSLHRHFDVHQDWSFVDEERFASVYAWMPLQAVDAQNGALRVFPASHRMMTRIRGANIPSDVYHLGAHIRKRYGRLLPMQEGEVLLFHQGLLHASPPNRSLSVRYAAGLGFVPQEAQVWHFFKEVEHDQVYRMPADVDFFMRYSERMDFARALKDGKIPIPAGPEAEPIDHKPHFWDAAEFDGEYQRILHG